MTTPTRLVRVPLPIPPRYCAVCPGDAIPPGYMEAPEGHLVATTAALPEEAEGEDPEAGE